MSRLNFHWHHRFGTTGWSQVYDCESAGDRCCHLGVEENKYNVHDMNRPGTLGGFIP